MILGKVVCEILVQFNHFYHSCENQVLFLNGSSVKLLKSYQ